MALGQMSAMYRFASGHRARTYSPMCDMGIKRAPCIQWVPPFGELEPLPISRLALSAVVRTRSWTYSYPMTPMASRVADALKVQSQQQGLQRLKKEGPWQNQAFPGC